MREIIRGTSEFALLIHNCPEREGFKNIKVDAKIDPTDTYSYHIGNALYEMNRAKHVRVESARRTSQRKPKGMLDNDQPRGLSIHRDSLENEQKDIGEYIIFSCPYNGEHALTEVINLRRAIESLSPEVREKVMVRIEEKLGPEHGGEIIPCNLNDVLHNLNKPVTSENFIRSVTMHMEAGSYEPASEESKAFQDAVTKHGMKVDLQPGDLLVVNENNMFHRAHRGDPESINKIPITQPLSRVLIHNAGAVATR